MVLEAVQAHAGHRSIESARIYLHLTGVGLAEEYRTAAALIDVSQGHGGHIRPRDEAPRPFSTSSRSPTLGER